MGRNLRFPPRTSDVSPSGAIAIRRAMPDDAQAAVAAFNDVFGVQRSPEYWLRKFESPEGMIAFLAIDDAGTVSAQFAASPVIMRRGKELVPVLNAGDVFARRSPQAIRQRLFLRTQATFHKHFAGEGRYANIFAFPNEVSLNVSHHVRPEIESLLLKEYEIVAFLEPPAPTWRRLWRRPQPVRVATYTDFLPAFRDGVDAVWRSRSRLPAPPEMGRSPGWAEWRYKRVGRHYGAYKFHLVLVGDACVGWCVTREIGQSLILVDWTPANEHAATYRHLADALKQIAKDSTAIQLRALASYPALLPFRNFLQWRELEGAIVPFGTMVYTGTKFPVHEMRLTFGDTDLR